VARTLARPESNAEDDPSRSLAALGLVEATLDDPKKASDYFNRAREADPMMPLLVLDKAIADAQSHNDSVLSKLKIARRDYLESFDPFEGRSPGINRYACEHNAFVIGASDLVINAQDELKRWQKNYPYAELGAPTPNNQNWVPIIVESFLTCAGARQLINELKSKAPQSQPFVGAWYPNCPACSGVPRRLGERNPAE
jgi:hypothetical protein